VRGVVVDLLGLHRADHAESSAATEAMCGKRSLTSMPDFPCFEKFVKEPRAFNTCTLQLGELLAFGERLGERFAVERLQFGLPVEGLELRGARPPCRGR
jgi:hypothetical protein